MQPVLPSIMKRGTWLVLAPLPRSNPTVAASLSLFVPRVFLHGVCAALRAAGGFGWLRRSVASLAAADRCLAYTSAAAVASATALLRHPSAFAPVALAGSRGPGADAEKGGGGGGGGDSGGTESFQKAPYSEAAAQGAPMPPPEVCVRNCRWYLSAARACEAAAADRAHCVNNRPRSEVDADGRHQT